MRNALLLISAAIILNLPVYAVNLPDYGLEQFRMNIGARPLSLGESFAGMSNDENACFYNPGGLPWSKGITVFVKDANNISAAQAYPTGFGSTIGIAVIQSGISSFLSPTGQTVDLTSNTLVLSAASKLLDKIGIGVNIKYILSETFRATGALDRTAQGWEADAGAMYKALPWLSIGVNARDILSGGTVKWDDGKLEGIPAKFNGGLSAKIIGDARSPIYLEGNEVSLNLDAQAQNNSAGLARFGAEWAFRGAFSLRIGSSSLAAPDAASIGLGFWAGGWGIDIAYYKDLLLNQRGFGFSLLYDPEEWAFEKKVEEKKYGKVPVSELVTDLSPADETSTYDDAALISGKANPGVAVAINGHPIALDEKGGFMAQMPLNPGKNLLLVEITYGEGRAAVTRKIFRKPKIIIAEEKKLEEELKKPAPKEDQEKLKQELEKVKERKQKVEALVTLGVVDAAPQAEFRLEAPVTRGELAGWLAKAAGLPLARITAPVFPDVPADHPMAPYIKASADNNLMQAIGGKFMPDAPVSKAEAQDIFRKFGAIR